MSDSATSWARDALSVDGDDVFRALEQGATVALIATPSEFLIACDADQSAAEVATDPAFSAFDFVPVKRNDEFVGLLKKGQEAGKPSSNSPSTPLSVGDVMDPLSERNLISADAGILAFVATADRQSCRLLVKGTQIAGIVTIADLQKLPVRPVLFLLVTHVELLMADRIRKHFSTPEGWIEHLSEGRKGKLEQEFGKLKSANIEPLDKLVATNYCDKRTILINAALLPAELLTNPEADLKRIEQLRNSVAHAGSYAETPHQAQELAETVRLIQTWIKGLQAQPQAQTTGTT